MKECTCEDCGQEHKSKFIKFKTPYIDLTFKSNDINIVALEGLLRRTIFELEINSILSLNDIE